MPRKFISSFILLFTLLTASAHAQDAVLRQVKDDIDTLTSAAMAGRGYVQQGHLKAARYIKSRFKEIGLAPLEGKWSQNFEMPVNIIHDSHLIINGDSLRPGIDYLPYATSGSGSATQMQKITYGEQGLFIPEKEINQLPIYSARGSILVVDDHFPDSLETHKKQNPTFYSKSYRIQAAQAIQANSLIFLVPELMYSIPFYQNKIPVFEVYEHSWPLTLHNISYKIEAEFDTVTTQNVYGMVKGTVHPDSAILITAHYDHFGKITEDIYLPGANDNASGVAMLLAVAKHFRNNPPSYSMIFIAFGGEEAGLKGSDYWVNHPPFPLEKTAFILNYDMVASGEQGIVAVGGKDFPKYFAKLKAVNDKLDLGPLKARENTPNSDQYRFLDHGVPGFYLYTNQGKQPYHHVNDKMETLEWNDFYEVYRLSVQFLKSVSNPNAKIAN